ncbi:MAG: hypothetical protein U0800_22755 [Isosphaeraceae bacterium]
MEGDTFDPHRQMAVKTVPTLSPDQNKRVACRLRPGFKSGERVVRRELVSVYTHKA